MCFAFCSKWPWYPALTLNTTGWFWLNVYWRLRGACTQSHGLTFFPLLTRNWLHYSQITYQHEGNSVAGLNRIEVTSKNQWKESATWVCSVTQASTMGILYSVLCSRSIPWLCTLLMHTENLWASWNFWWHYWIFEYCWFFLFCFWWLAYKPAFFGGQKKGMKLKTQHVFSATESKGNRS